MNIIWNNNLQNFTGLRRSGSGEKTWPLHHHVEFRKKIEYFNTSMKGAIQVNLMHLVGWDAQTEGANIVINHDSNYS